MHRITNISATPQQVSQDGSTLDVGATDVLDPAGEYVARGLERGHLYDLGDDPPLVAASAPAAGARGGRN